MRASIVASTGTSACRAIGTRRVGPPVADRGWYRGFRHDWHLKIYDATFAAGPPDNAKLSDVLEHLNET